MVQVMRFIAEQWVWWLVLFLLWGNLCLQLRHRSPDDISPKDAPGILVSALTFRIHRLVFGWFERKYMDDGPHLAFPVMWLFGILLFVSICLNILTAIM